MDKLEIFENYLATHKVECPSYHPYFEEAMNYMLGCGGKHFRAQLVLGITEALDPQMLENALGVALSVEMMHTYSLIHDDLPIMDDASLRRGHATTHVKYDEVTALLVGDALNTNAFLAIIGSNLPSQITAKCVEILAQNAGANGMVLGQACDCFFEKKPLNLGELIFLHGKKTGALIAASMQLGALIGGADEGLQKSIYDLGLKLGLAFQINDDIIDATQSEKEAGKPTNNDTFKNSFTNLLGIDEAIKYKQNLINKITDESAKFGQNLQDLIQNLIDKYLKG